MIIQGIKQGEGTRGQNFLLAGLLTAATLYLTACSAPVKNSVGPDRSHLSSAELLNVFLKNETSRGPVKFTFSGDIEVQAGGLHRFRGACGYTSCGDLRIQLLGPFGFTLLDYVNAQGRATLVANKLTPEGDDEALQGLMKLMEIFALALLDRCQASAGVDVQPQQLGSANFVTQGRSGTQVRFKLDKKKAVILQQTVKGDTLPTAAIDYTDHVLVDGYWMPGTISIQTTDMPVAIHMEIGQWKIAADLPEYFFLVE